MRQVRVAALGAALIAALAGCKQEGTKAGGQAPGTRSGYDTPLGDAGQPPPGAAGGRRVHTGAAAGAPDAATAPAEDPKREAQEVFASRCAACHGPAGQGDGPASAALKPKPRDLQDPAWQRSVTDQHIERIIEGGGAAVGKSPLMPPNPDLAGRPVIQALREHVRGLGGKGTGR